MYMLCIMEKEKIWTLAELEEVKRKVKAECWKIKNGICKLGTIEMYDHDGGEWIQERERKQWVYFTCQICNYQWALHKLLRRLEEGSRA